MLEFSFVTGHKSRQRTVSNGELSGNKTTWPRKLSSYLSWYNALILHGSKDTRRNSMVNTTVVFIINNICWRISGYELNLLNFKLCRKNIFVVVFQICICKTRIAVWSKSYTSYSAFKLCGWWGSSLYLWGLCVSGVIDGNVGVLMANSSLFDSNVYLPQ